MIRTIQTISGRNVKLNPADVEVMERFEEAIKASSSAFQKISKKIAKMTDDTIDHKVLKDMCGIVRSFVDTVFGDGTADEVFGDTNDVEELMRFYSDVLAAFDEEGDRLTGVLSDMWKAGDNATAG